MADFFAFQWHILDDCDQRCKHCYIFSEENDKEFNDDGSECIGILSKKGIQTQICDILEGGRMAFELRKNKYSVNLNT